MHYQCKPASRLLYAVSLPSRRQRRKAAAHHRHASATPTLRDFVGLELADRVERLTYTRKQAAEALGLSLATLDRRVVPVIETVTTEWGGRLIPVSELEAVPRGASRSTTG